MIFAYELMRQQIVGAYLRGYEFLQFLTALDVSDTVLADVSAFKYGIVINVPAEGAVILLHMISSFSDRNRCMAVLAVLLM